MIHIIRLRILICICLSVLFSPRTFGQSIGDFQSISSGSWSLTTTWQQCLVAGSWAAATATPTSAHGVIRIKPGHTVTVGTFAVTADQIIVENTGVLSISSGMTLTINDGVGTDLQIDAGGNLVNNGTLDKTTAIINNSGIITNSNTITSTSAATFNFLAGSFYKHNFQISVGTIPAATWNTTSTCEILACLSPSSGPIGIGQRFGHFIWNTIGQTAGDINLAGLFPGALPIYGNFTLKSTGLGRLVLKGSSGTNTGIGGNFSIEGGTLIGTNGTVGIIGSNLTLTVTGNYVQSGGVFILAENPGTGTGNGSGTLTVSGTTTISGGTLTLTNSNSIGSQGNGTLNANGDLLVSGGNLNLTTSSGDGTGGNGTIYIAASKTLTVSSGYLNLTNSIRTTGGGIGIVNCPSGLITLSGGGIMGPTSNAITSGCNATINADLGFTISGGILNLTCGTFSGGGGNGTINTSAFNVSGGTAYINSGSGANSTGSNGLIAVTGNCLISGTGSVNVNSGSVTTGGGNGTITVTGTFTHTSSGTFNLCSSSGSGNGILNVTGAFTHSNGTMNLCSSSGSGNGKLTASNAFTKSGAGTLNLCSSAAGTGFGELNIYGNFLHSGGNISKTAVAAANTGTINIFGTTATTIESFGFIAGSNINFNITKTTISGTTSIALGKIFNVSNGTILNLNDNGVTSTDLTVSGTLNVSGIMNVNLNATLDLGTTFISNTVAASPGNFFLNSNTTLITKHAGGISTTPNLTGCIQVTGTRSLNTSASYIFNGTTAQITGYGLTSTIKGLTIDNTSSITTGGVTLTQPTTITGTLTLTKGRLFTSATSIVTIGNGATSSPGFLTSATLGSFVDGPIKKIGFTGAEFVFPTGDVYLNSSATLVAKWARVSFPAPGVSTTNAFTAEYDRKDSPNTTQVVSLLNGLGIDHVSFKENWEITRDAGIATPAVKLFWEDNTFGSNGSSIPSPTIADLRVAETDGPGLPWDDRGATGIVTAGITGNITSNITTTFAVATGVKRYFTFAAPNSINPLPIELLSFEGTAEENGNILNWTTATETNNDYFILERSSDGNSFIAIASIDGSGNSKSIQDYQYLDANPNEGTNYYRLKQVDFNEEFSYFNIIVINKNNLFSGINSNQVKVYPNPSQNIVNINLPNEITSISIYDMVGNIIYSNSTEQKNFQFNSLPQGIYILKAISASGDETNKRFIRN